MSDPELNLPSEVLPEPPIEQDHQPSVSNDDKRWAAPETARFVGFHEPAPDPIAEPDVDDSGWAISAPSRFIAPDEPFASPPTPTSIDPEDEDTAPLDVQSSLIDQPEQVDSLSSIEPDLYVPISPTDSRIDALTRKIEQYPAAPVNYVLRGEIYLLGGDRELAAADFERAIDLAEQRDPELDWGYINAAYIDRAVAGLRQANHDL